MCGCIRRSASSSANWSAFFVSSLKGISTEVDSFSRAGLRRSSSAWRRSIETLARVNSSRVVSSPSLRRPSRMCSVPMTLLPCWLAS